MIAEQSFDAPDLIRGLSRQRASVTEAPYQVRGSLTLGETP